MEQIISIPELSVELRFTGNQVSCYDQLTKQLLDYRQLNQEIERVRQKDYNKFLLIDVEGEELDLEIRFINEVHSLKTNAEYILELFMDSPNHGYYFGLYEIGEFSIHQDRTLELNRSFALKYCIRGLVTSDEHIFISLRENGTIRGKSSYFLAKLSWPRNSDPVILWKKPVSSPIQFLIFIKDYLLLGLNDGTIQQWDATNDEFMQTFSLFTAPVTFLMKGKEKVFVASGNGELVVISKNGSVCWRSTPSNHSIHGLIEDERGIHFIDRKGIYFLLDTETGAILRHEDCNLNPSVYSNLALLRDWFVVNDGRGIQAFHWEYKKHFFQVIPDLYIRQLQSFPIGILTGDDGGFIRLWIIGQLIL